MDSLPEKRSARPLARDEHAQCDTPLPAGQAKESALMQLCKAWLRAGATDRRLFLADVHAGNGNLWRAVERDAQRGV